MEKIFLTAIFCLFFIIPGFSQEFAPIVAKKKGLGTRYFQSDKQLKGKDLQSALKSNELSIKEYKAANINSTVGGTMIATGALVMGVSSLAQSLQDVNDLNSGSLPESHGNMGFYAGCGFVIAGIPFLLMGNSHLVKAITLYNSQNITGDISDIKLNMGFAKDGIGLILHF